MNRIKQAWLALTGRQQALDVTPEAASKLTSEAAKYGLDVTTFLTTIIDIHHVISDDYELEGAVEGALEKAGRSTIPTCTPGRPP
ncbi:hypothetical protein [Streptomyces sp. 5-10]|uniref:hypothetical protein n=1 Tax=Streptomyces sp. 5-10 TaxID=878925 RepID=UPI00168ADA7B|nr:hypothetical protein [Streptomyces sp. 5-10]MBD3004696.1 hypothetical protein [Streptomyces sp. 5-10]